MVLSADEKLAPADLLEVAFQTQVGVAFRQQLGIDRAVRGVTGRAALVQGLVLELPARIASETEISGTAVFSNLLIDKR